MSRLLLTALLLLASPAWAAPINNEATAAIERKDYAEAIKWYRLAATQGNAKAQNNLGFMYLEGMGVVQDYTEAVKWYKLAAAQGDSSALFGLGVLYETAKGVVQDYAEAVKWYKLAAAQGVDGAQHNLGVLYGQGRGIPQDYVRAHMWLNLAAATRRSELGVKHRDFVESKMSPQQMAEAQKLARECQARNFKGCD